ncbi:MAG: biotin carboxylase [Cryomorphaceae bacterium]|nr:biotin carboxylase [Cryomorphaceae bacterium]
MKKLLVANRGEIALRIMRTARQMGIATVAVYSEADADAPHVHFADEAYLVGPAPSNQSYLNVAAVVAACKASGADAVHPGYGFLSENADFAERIQREGIIWVGPPASAIRVMGDKLSAKAAAAQFDVPLVPGSDGAEKFVTSPRHIEIQVLSDQHGTHLHLFERECSVQRRHQKVVEEAPSAILCPELRAQMGDAAVKAAQSCGYVGAGTVEFIFDASGAFYFLEMNTRLQVEHPVTEEVTGLDLVAEQIRIARGEKLPYRQEDLKLNGHAIELRVYAEDVANNFAPDTGVLEVYRRPTGAGIRVDDGVREGQEVSVYYDPMLAKLIAWGPDRETARQRLLAAIDRYAVVGVKNTLRFGRFILEHPDFVSGHFDTGFVAKNFTPEALEPRPQGAEWAAALAEYYRPQPAAPPVAPSLWKTRHGL